MGRIGRPIPVCLRIPSFFLLMAFFGAMQSASAANLLDSVAPLVLQSEPAGERIVEDLVVAPHVVSDGRADGRADNGAIEPASYSTGPRYQNRQAHCPPTEAEWHERWKGRFEVGLNGSEGDNQNLNLVVGFDAKQESGLDTLALDVDYLFSIDDSVVSKNRFYSLTRFERDIPDSPWGWFVDNWFEFDEFEEFKSRLGFHGGLIRTIIDTDKELLKGLIGFGTSRELAGPNQVWRPEAFIGVAWEKDITDEQKCYIKAMCYPDVRAPESFRFLVRAGWECALTEEEDLFLSLSAFNRYDSTPGGDSVKNNLDYWASLIWGF